MPDFGGLQLARKQIQFARDYTLPLLEDIHPDDWFRSPDGCATHLAWQVGHLAMAEYGLCMFRIRGRQPEDLQLMSSKFRKQFSRGATPEPDPAKNPSIDEIRGVFDHVHAQAMDELASCDEASLNDPVEMPYAVSATKLGCLFFCSHHEMVHAGQIGVLRRMLGRDPIR